MLLWVKIVLNSILDMTHIESVLVAQVEIQFGYMARNIRPPCLRILDLKKMGPTAKDGRNWIKLLMSRMFEYLIDIVLSELNFLIFEGYTSGAKVLSTSRDRTPWESLKGDY